MLNFLGFKNKNEFIKNIIPKNITYKLKEFDMKLNIIH